MRNLLVLVALVAPLAAGAQSPPASSAPSKVTASRPMVLSATTSPAKPPAPPREASGAFLAGVKVGGLVPFNKLQPAVGVAVELGWLLPWRDRAFAALLEVSYAQPTASGHATDPRVGGAANDWKLVQRVVVVAPTGLYRFTGLGALVPYAGLGPRIYLYESKGSGTAGGQPMAATTEQATRLGLGAPLGLEYALGPGQLTGEALFEWGGLDTRSAGTGTSLSGATLRVGYRLVF
jgi:opacity protein-like surface antigen